jgi:hypothetical protein
MKKLIVTFLLCVVNAQAVYSDHELQWAEIFDRGAKVLHAQTFNLSTQTRYEVQTVMSVLLKEYYDKENVLAMCWHTATQGGAFRSNTFTCEVTNEDEVFHHIPNR